MGNPNEKKQTVVTEDRRSRSYIPAEDFVRAWQEAETYPEFARRTGLRGGQARATRYRKLGIPLKRFSSSHTPLDVDGLRRLAESLAPR